MLGFIENNQWLSACTGIELHILPDNSYSGRFCSVSLDKEQLSIGDKLIVDGDLEEVLKKIEDGEPFGISLTGKGILLKKITRLKEINQQSLTSIFPNLQLENFYVQNFISNEYSFIALVRKDVIDRIIETAAALGLKLMFISLGPFVLSHVLSQINSYDDEIVFDGHQIKYNKEYQWNEYRYSPGILSEFSIKIDIEHIPEKNLIAYATAFQLALFNRLDPIQISTNFTSKQQLELREEKKFKLRLTVLLAMSFTLLLFNFLLLNWYNSKNIELLSIQDLEGTESIQKLEQEIASKEKQLELVAWNKGMSYSFLSDQIGQTAPGSITLEELEINPVNSAAKLLTNGNTYNSNQIRVKGKTSSIQSVNSWIYTLRKREWVKKVALESYLPSNAQEDKRQQFVIRIFF